MPRFSFEYYSTLQLRVRNTSFCGLLVPSPLFGKFSSAMSSVRPFLASPTTVNGGTLTRLTTVLPQWMKPCDLDHPLSGFTTP